MAEVYPVQLSLDECDWTWVMTSQHWFRLWLGAMRLQATTWANVDQALFCHMASLGHNEWNDSYSLVHDYANLIANILELLQSCTKPLLKMHPIWIRSKKLSMNGAYHPGSYYWNILVPYLYQCNSFEVWTPRFHLCVSNHQRMSSRDLTTWPGIRIVVPEMATGASCLTAPQLATQTLKQHKCFPLDFIEVLITESRDCVTSANTKSTTQIFLKSIWWPLSETYTRTSCWNYTS